MKDDSHNLHRHYLVTYSYGHYFLTQDLGPKPRASFVLFPFAPFLKPATSVEVDS